MFALLAQVQPAAPAPSSTTNVLHIITGIFSRPDALAHPDTLTDNLKSMSAVWAIVFLAAGLMCIINGYKFYKPVTVLLALVIGASAGHALGHQIKAEESVIAGCIGALLAATCMPLMKYAVAVMGGLSGAFIGANAWTAIAKMAAKSAAAGNAAATAGAATSGGAADHYWVGALIGLILFGMLAFIMFKLSIVMFTSVSGSTLAVLGAMALLLQVPEWQPTVTRSLSSHTIVTPMLVLVPAMIGLILQQARPDKPEAAPAAKK